jgi:hypothetical protein
MEATVDAVQGFADDTMNAQGMGVAVEGLSVQAAKVARDC